MIGANPANPNPIPFLIHLRAGVGAHQESDVVPENVDAIRALTGSEADWRASVAQTDAAIAVAHGSA